MVPIACGGRDTLQVRHKRTHLSSSGSRGSRRKHWRSPRIRTVVGGRGVRVDFHAGISPAAKRIDRSLRMPVIGDSDAAPFCPHLSSRQMTKTDLGLGSQ
jgi:hypothetical protein